jgi:hypothetical protein
MTESQAISLQASDRNQGWRIMRVLCLAFIFTTRLWLVERYGAPVAMIDEWEATGSEILAPWHSGKLTVAALFQAHNGDHRIVATRLLEIMCYELNGSWDPKLVLTVKAAIYAAAATLLIQLLVGRMRKWRLQAGALLCVLFAFPFNWQNLIWAFQSQFDFFLLAVGLGWLALINNRPGAALVAAFLSLFTLGAGPVIAFSYIPFMLWRGYCREISMRSALLFVAIAGLIGLFGVSLRGEQAAKVGSPVEQLVSLNAALAWPYSNMMAQLPAERTVRLVPSAIRNFPNQERSVVMALSRFIGRNTWILIPLNAIFALIILSPVLCQGLETLRKRSWPIEASGGLGITCFALLMVLATAIARAGQTTIAVRYLDLVCLVGFSSIAAAFSLSGTRPRRWLRLWSLFMAVGYLSVMTATMAKLGHRMPAYWLSHLQQYFPSHNHEILKDNQAGLWPILEYASVPDFMASLDDPAMEAILPHSLTKPDAPLGPAAKAAAMLRKASGVLLLGLSAMLAWFGIVGRIPRLFRRSPDFEEQPAPALAAKTSDLQKVLG